MAIAPSACTARGGPRRDDPDGGGKKGMPGRKPRGLWTAIESDVYTTDVHWPTVVWRAVSTLLSASKHSAGCGKNSAAAPGSQGELGGTLRGARLGAKGSKAMVLCKGVGTSCTSNATPITRRQQGRNRFPNFSAWIFVHW